MRGLIKKIGALMTAMRQAVSHLALVAIRGVDGAITWSWEVVSRAFSGGVTAPVDYEPMEMDVSLTEPASDEDLNGRMLLQTGEMVVAAALSIVRGQGVPVGTDPVIGLYLLNLHRDDQWTLATGDPLAVGRHVAGVETMMSSIGLPIRRPEPEADADREVVRKKKAAAHVERQRLSHAEMSAAARRVRQDRIEWEAAGLSPVLTLTP